MKSSYPLEALLRPAVEMWPASAALATAGLAVGAPWALMMPPRMSEIAAVLLVGFAAVRYRQAYRVLRYRRHMRRLPAFTMKAKAIPVSKRKLYLGRGFRWEQKHTQRLRDSMRPETAGFVNPGVVYQALRRFENIAEHKALLRPLASITSATAWWNPWQPLPPVGGKAQIHGVEPDEQNVLMDLGERVGHTAFYGATRVGKTRAAEIVVTQDIRRGDVTIVIDPKGDPGLMLRCYAEAKRAGRLDHFYLFHLGHPEISARYNAIGDFSRITQVATRLTNPLPSTGNSAAFREFCWRFSNIIARAISALGRKPDYAQILRAVNDIEPLFLEYAHHWLATSGPAGWQEQLALVRKQLSPNKTPRALEGRSPDAVALLHFIKTNSIREPVLEGLASVFKYDRTYFDKLVSSLGPLLEKLTSGPVAALLSPDYFDVNDQRPIFDWMKVIRQRGIVYVGLDALTDSAVATAVGNSMFADLVSVAGSIYNHGIDGLEPSRAHNLPRTTLHLDEFSDLVGDEFVPMANKMGGAGFQLNVYTQTAADVEAKMGSHAKAQQVIGNLNTTVMFRVKSIETARILTDQLPEVDVVSITQVSGVTDASEGIGIDFISRNEDRLVPERVPMVGPAEVMALPKGQAFALLEGGQLWKLRMPLPDPGGDDLIPQSLVDLADKMARSYRTGEGWWHGAEDGAPTTDSLDVSDVDGPAPAGIEVGTPVGDVGAAQHGVEATT